MHNNTLTTRSVYSAASTRTWPRHSSFRDEQDLQGFVQRWQTNLRDTADAHMAVLIKDGSIVLMVHRAEI
jgi:hypothetical protein